MTEPMSFESVEQSPRYAELMRFTPSTSGMIAVLVVLLVFLAGFTGVALFMTVPFLLMGPFALIPLLMALLGGGLFVMLLLRTIRVARAPIDRAVMVVRDKTSEVDTHTHGSGRDRNLHTTTTYYLLLEGRDGQRASHDVDDELWRTLLVGDAGVAYLKAGDLVDFKPVQPKNR